MPRPIQSAPRRRCPVSEVGVKLSGDNAEFKGMLDNSLSATASFGDKMGHILGEVGTGFLKAFAVEAVVERLKELIVQTFENAERLHNLSRELGVSTTFLQAFSAEVTHTGGTTEAATKVLEKARLSLDQLADGNKTAEDAFAKLRLSAKDFIGLSLDESLEKISAAYTENKNEAGAYNAVAEILGKRTLPQVLNALNELGENGLKPTIEHMKALGQVQSQSTIDTLATTVRGLGMAWQFVKTGVGELTADIVRLGESVLAVATGDMRTLKAIWAERNHEIAGTEKEIAAAIEKGNEAMKGATALAQERTKEEKEYWKTEEAINKFNEAVAEATKKAGLDELKNNESIAKAMDKQIDANKTLIAQAKEKAIAEASVLTEFEKQLDVIRQMGGGGKSGFKAGSSGGGAGTITVGEIESALRNAESAKVYAERPENINATGGVQTYSAAVQLVSDLKDNLRAAQFMGQSIGAGFGAVEIGMLPHSLASSGPSSDRVAAAAAQAGQKAQIDIAKNMFATMVKIQAGLVQSGIIGEGTSYSETGAGGAPSGESLIPGGGFII